MNNLFEVVFEGIDRNCVVRFLLHFISSSKQIISITCSENVVFMEGGVLNAEGLESVININEDMCVLIKLQDMKASSVLVPDVLLRLVKYGEEFDVDFSFDASKLKNIDEPLITKHLHAFAEEMAKDVKLKNFFGGMEPASDESTRYFTNKNTGPLSLAIIK